MILADSILQTASMALCVSVAVMATHHTIFNPVVQARDAGILLRGICRGSPQQAGAPMLYNRRPRARAPGEPQSRPPNPASISCEVP